MPGGPINLAPPQRSGLPRTWNPPCPSGEHYLNVLDRRNGRDEDLDWVHQSNARADDVVAAAKLGAVCELRALLDSGCTVASRDTDGVTALIWASRRGHVPCIALLLDRCADVDAQDRMGNTALMAAASSNYPEAVQKLLAAGASPRVVNHEYETALHGARDVNSSACIAQLASALSAEERLLEAAKSGDVAQLSELLEAGVKLTAVDELLQSQSRHQERCTVLHWASAHGHPACILTLLEHGAVVDAADRCGWTPLMAAVGNWQPDAVRTLLASRANVWQRDSSGRTASCWMAKGTRNPCALLLQDAMDAEPEPAAPPSDSSRSNGHHDTLPEHGVGRARRLSAHIFSCRPQSKLGRRLRTWLVRTRSTSHVDVT
jgi:ankyrin repeat protein